ncbi:MAG: hypothetical protein PHD48_01175 [Alphaproteobacteria bacterium]|nr:hypothetical protein [Alphaproteobacteria bacterium]
MDDVGGTSHELAYAVTGHDLYYRFSAGQTAFQCRASNVRQYVIVSGNFSQQVAKESRDSHRIKAITTYFLDVLVDKMRRAAGAAVVHTQPHGKKKQSWWRCKVGGAGKYDAYCSFDASGSGSEEALSFDVYRTKNRHEAPFAKLRVNPSYAGWLIAALPHVMLAMRKEELLHRSRATASLNRYDLRAALNKSFPHHS